PRDDRHRLRRGARIVADADVVLDADVQPLGVLANEDDVEIAVAAARNDRVGGADVGVEIERLAERDVDRPVAFADRRLQRPLERKLGALDRIERAVGDRVAVPRHAGHAGDLGVPLDRRAGGGKDASRCLRDRRTDAVAGNQGDRSGHVLEVRVTERSLRNAHLLPAHCGATIAAIRAPRLAVIAGVNASTGSLDTSPDQRMVDVRASSSTSRNTPRPPVPAFSNRSSTGASTSRTSSCSATSVRTCDASGSGSRASGRSDGARSGSSARAYGSVAYVGLCRYLCSSASG